MDKKELKNKLEELKKQIKANSKDAHYADTLISEFMSVHGQLKHEPILIHIPLDSIAEETDGGNFTMAITKDGKAIYHVRGGYDLIVDGSYHSLFETIQASIDFMNGKVELDEDGKEIMENDILATTYLLNLPLIAMSDYEFKYKMTNEIIKYLNSEVEKAVNAELQEETLEENRAFQEAVEGLENVKEALNEEL